MDSYKSQIKSSATTVKKAPRKPNICKWLAGVIFIPLTLSACAAVAIAWYGAGPGLTQPIDTSQMSWRIHVHPSPVTLDEANEIVNKNGGGLFLDGASINSESLVEFERSLSRDVEVNEPINVRNSAKYLLGTNIFWTGAPLDWSRLHSLTLNPLTYEAAVTENKVVLGDQAYLDGDFDEGSTLAWCYEPEYYESLITSHEPGLKFRFAVETSCAGHMSSPNTLRRTCRNTCFTLVPDDPSSKHLVAYYKNEEAPTINLDWPIVKVRSYDNRFDFVFHAKKVARSELVKILKHLGAETLSLSSIWDEDWNKMSDAFRNVKVPANVLSFWTRGGRMSMLYNTNSERWCSHSDEQPIDNQMAITVINGSLCVKAPRLTADGPKTTHYLAYQVPVKTDTCPSKAFASFCWDFMVAAAWKWLPNVPSYFI